MRRSAALAKAYSVAKNWGVDRAVSGSSWRRRRLLILCWHGISLDDEHRWDPRLYISPSLFRRRLQVLAEGNYNVLPLNEALNRMSRGDLPPRTVVLTFDDGFYNFSVHAAPTLAEFGFPATVYLTTYYVDHQAPVQNLMNSYLKWKCGVPGAAPIDYDSLLERRLLHLMNPDEVQRLSKQRIVFEAHTHRHRTPAEPALMRRELRENMNRIEEITGRRPRHFCYPSGNYCREHFPIFEQEGLLSATTCEPGISSKADSRYLLPRLLDHGGVSDDQYEAWLSGLLGMGRRTVAFS